MPYNINKSDATKTSLTVPDMPPGINTADTSLKLIGKNYPNFGQALAENFLHLLENFASPTPPNNPIEGQLWYDTADSAQKKLYVFDNNTWTPTNGVHQLATDPQFYTTPGLSVNLGDLWVDTSSLQLKIWNGLSWTLVGPGIAGTTRTGPYPEDVEDTTGTLQPIIKMYVAGEVLEIISGTAFTPRAVIDGFTNIVPGVNLSTKMFSSMLPKVDGVAKSALSLKQTFPAVEEVSANNFVRNDIDQGISGSLSINNNSGLRIGSTTGTFVLQKGSLLNPNDATFINLVDNSRFIFQVDKNSALKTIFTLNSDSSASNQPKVITGANNYPVDLEVTGNVSVTKKVTINTSTGVGLEIIGDVKTRNIVSSGTISVSSTTAIRGILTLGKVGETSTLPALLPATTGRYNLGSVDYRFSDIYALSIQATNITGSLNGPATRLASTVNFSLTGTVVSSLVSFNGTQNVVFSTTVTNKLILDCVESTPAVWPIQQSDMLLFSSGTNVTTAVLKKTSKQNLLADLYDGRSISGSVVGNIDTRYTDIIKPGTIMQWSGPATTDPITSELTENPGWLICDGNAYLKDGPRYSRLFGVIGITYGYINTNTDFMVPQIPPIYVPGATTGTIAINYIIKL